jgi:phenylalanyl-tRNA synthetase beta chain
MDANKLFEIFQGDVKMKKFLPILQGFEKYPAFFDSERNVLSLPPIINSEKTKITTDTKNVFIEITGTDIMKTKVCLAILAAQFSSHCKGEWQHHVEQVRISYEGSPEKDEITPTMDYVNFEVELANLNKILGLKLDSDKIKDCAIKMGLELIDSSDDGSKLEFEVPPTRADILHPCDVIEDIGIGYGFNNIERVYPPTNTVGSFQPNNKFADLLRGELA